MKILMVSTEVAPYAKAGGLADMVSALSKTLSTRGHDVRIVCPLYGCIRKEAHWQKHPTALVVHLGNGRRAYCARWEGILADSTVHLYFLELQVHFGYPEIYTGPWGAHGNNDERFTCLSRAAIDLCYALNWMPDIVHAHDWPGGLLPVYLNTVEQHTPFGQAASILTIHNMKHQGQFHADILDFAGIPYSTFRPDGLECLGGVNFLKAGLYHATKIIAVSPTYAREIQTPELGHGLDPVARFRSADLIGILNGIDEEHWNPAHDEHLPFHYTANNLDGKKGCKAILQRRLGLTEDPHVLIYAAVASMDPQKGLDFIAEIIPAALAHLHCQIIILGTGDQALEHWFLELSYRFPGQLAVHIGYDNALAHLIEAGADVFLMPSRFEPCGLNQMYSMRYGTPPIVRATGGLLDSVEPYQQGTFYGTGFVFKDPDAQALYNTMGWACSTYYDRPDAFRALMINGMQKDFSWEHSAQAYEQVYSWALQAKGK